MQEKLALKNLIYGSLDLYKNHRRNDSFKRSRTLYLECETHLILQICPVYEDKEAQLHLCLKGISFKKAPPSPPSPGRCTDNRRVISYPGV